MQIRKVVEERILKKEFENKIVLVFFFFKYIFTVADNQCLRNLISIVRIKIKKELDT